MPRSSRAMTVESAASHSRGAMASESCIVVVSLRGRGRRECRMQAAPAGLACKGKCTLRTQATQVSRNTRHSLRDRLRFIRDLLGAPAFWPPSLAEIIIRELDPSVGGSGPHDFAVRLCRVRLTQHQRPSHPRPTCRDDRPKRPSSSRRDARDDGCDLPDGASVCACGRLARRAICAWGVCGNCPSGARVQCTSQTRHLGVCDQSRQT